MGFICRLAADVAAVHTANRCVQALADAQGLHGFSSGALTCCCRWVGLQDPSRSILGAQQKAYLKDQLAQAQSGGQIWKIIGQQVTGCPPRMNSTAMGTHNVSHVKTLAVPALLHLASGMHSQSRSLSCRCVIRTCPAAAALSMGSTVSCGQCDCVPLRRCCSPATVPTAPRPSSRTSGRDVSLPLAMCPPYAPSPRCTQCFQQPLADPMPCLATRSQEHLHAEIQLREAAWSGPVA